jgi:2,4-diaminopentanoate dehydrogenase
LSKRFLDPIREATAAGNSSIFSSGIEPGFGCDLFPIALMTMSHTVYSVRGIEITNYSEYPVEWDVRELFGFGQPLDYQGGLKQPGVLRWGGVPPSPWSPTRWVCSSTRFGKRANSCPRRATCTRRAG